MESSIKLGEHVEQPINGDALDRISKLPDELLGHMLSFLETKFAVSASILSKRWRFLFTLTNCLYFNSTPSYGPSKVRKELEAARSRKFKEFVNKVLEMHQISSIKKFSLVSDDTYDDSELNQWVSTAMQKGVQDFHYQVAVQKGYKLPDGFFMCETIVRLTMMGCIRFVLNISVSAWLPSLKILHLCYVRFFNYESVGRLFSGCEVLEELTLKSCDCYTGCASIISSKLLKFLRIENCYFEKGLIEIDAPNLAYLSYSTNTGVKIVPSWGKSGTLVKADLGFDYSDAYNHDSLDYDRELLKAAASKVTALSLQSDSEEILLELVDQEHMPYFHSLSRLHISGGGSSTYDEWRHVSSLLNISPRLETIVFDWGLDCFCDDPMSAPALPSFLSSCPVKVIEVECFCGNVCLLRSPIN